MNFKVRPMHKIPFPIDMLRYDWCHPATENDSALIHGTLGDVRHRLFTDQNGDPIEIELYTEKAYPTPERWASFSWEVIE